MKLITDSLLNNVSGQAKENPRLRMNYNFHDSLDAKAQRLLNALEPGTELPVHRHCMTAETYIVIRTRIKKRFISFFEVVCLLFCLMKKVMLRIK